MVGTGGHPTGVVGTVVNGVIDGVRLDRNVGNVGRGEKPVVNVVTGDVGIVGVGMVWLPIYNFTQLHKKKYKICGIFYKLYLERA